MNIRRFLLLFLSITSIGVVAMDTIPTNPFDDVITPYALGNRALKPVKGKPFTPPSLQDCAVRSMIRQAEKSPAHATTIAQQLSTLPSIKSLQHYVPALCRVFIRANTESRAARTFFTAQELHNHPDIDTLFPATGAPAMLHGTLIAPGNSFKECVRLINKTSPPIARLCLVTYKGALENLKDERVKSALHHMLVNCTSEESETSRKIAALLAKNIPGFEQEYKTYRDSFSRHRQAYMPETIYFSFGRARQR